MRRPHLYASLLFSLGLLVALLVVTDWLPALRGPAPGTSEWHWPYELRPAQRWPIPIAAAFTFWLLLLWWQRDRRLPERLWLTIIVAGCLLLQLALVYPHRAEVMAELVDRTLADETNGYFAAAAQTRDMSALLREFPQTMPMLPSEHTRTHPPGLILAQWLTIQASSDVTGSGLGLSSLRCTDRWLLAQPPRTLVALVVWGFLPLVAASLTTIPTYYLARQLHGPGTGRLAAALTATLPSLLLFAPTPDQIFALTSALTFLLWLRAVRRRSHSLAFLSGLLVAAATFLSLGNGALVLPMAAFALLDNRRKSPSLSLGWIVAFMLGLASTWALYWAGWGVPPWQVAQVALGEHYALVTSQRRYDWWLIYNLVDVLIFAGPVVLGGFAAAALLAARRLARSTYLAAESFAISLFLLLAVLDLSGSARGEVGRIWLFFMPLLAVAAAGWLHPAKAVSATGSNVGAPQSLTTAQGFRLAVGAALVASQLVLATGIALAWKPIEAIIVVAERPEMPAKSRPERELSTVLGETIRLIGYDLEVSRGEAVVTLYWQATAPAARPYTVFTHLVDDGGELVAQKDGWPVGGRWPPTCWKRNEVVIDRYPIELPPGLPAGTYALLAGMYDADTGIRLVTADGRDAVLLEEVIVGE